ncbi:hypothetical protein Tco_0533566 [Tanacetum coccineum]
METIRPWLGLSLLQGIRGTSYNSIRETEALATSGQRQPAYDLAFHNIKRYPGPEARVHALTHWIDTVAVPRLWSLSHLGADKCQRVGHAGQRRTCRIRPATTTPKNRHFKRNCPRLRNNDRGNQAGNDRAPVKVYVVGNAGANPDNIVAGFIRQPVCHTLGAPLLFCQEERQIIPECALNTMGIENKLTVQNLIRSQGFDDLFDQLQGRVLIENRPKVMFNHQLRVREETPKNCLQTRYGD